MQPLIHVIYASLATPQFKEFHIPALLEQTRNANAQRDVTGMLLYIAGSFFQVLEGEAVQVDAVYERITHDSRHTRITQIIREPIVERAFNEWTMGFATLAGPDAGELIGENDFFADASCISKMDRGRAKKLLHAFAGGRWRLERTDMHRALGR
jgi:hypothetical protein